MKRQVVAACLSVMVGNAGADAVSGINGKIDFASGSFDGWSGKQGTASIAGPLTKNIGWQADLIWSEVGGEDFEGFGGHLFWRDPKIALLGVVASRIERDGVDSYQAGLEFEYYLSNVSILASAGYTEIEYDQPAFFIDTDAQGSFFNAEARYYLTDNFAISVGGRRALGNDLGVASLEYQTPFRGLSLFATAAQGENDYDHAMAGVRYYFGEPKSLKARQRTDDPDNATMANLSTLGLYGAEYNRKLAGHLNQQPIVGDVFTLVPVPEGYIILPSGETPPPYHPTYGFGLSGYSSSFGVTITSDPGPLIPDL